MSAQAFGVWARKPGAPVSTDDGKTVALWPDFPRWWGDQREDGGKRTVAKGRSVSDARGRLDNAAAELKEHELAERRGELMTAEQFRRTLDEAFGRASSKLRNLKRKIALLVTGATIAEREQQAAPLIEEVQAELAAGEDIPTNEEAA